MITLKKTKGYSIIEMLIAISALIFISLGYIKHKADLKVYEREQYLYNEIKENSLSYQKQIFNRVKNSENINIVQFNDQLKNFTYENCLIDNTGPLKEFQLSFCHVIDKNRNAQFNIYSCEDSSNVCFSYRPNRLAIENSERCGIDELCMEQVFWGLKTINNRLVIAGGN